jgi:murein DD-endopeptidase MepM/ murein hydrolase activator NlpD
MQKRLIEGGVLRKKRSLLQIRGLKRYGTGKISRFCKTYLIGKTNKIDKILKIVKTNLIAKICFVGKICLTGKTFLVGKACPIEEKLHIYKTFLAQRQTIYRAAVVSCLFALLVLNFSLPKTLASSAKQVKDQAPVEAGVGGGDYREKILPEEFMEAVNFELGMREPEAFSKPRTLLYSAYTVQKGDMIGGLAENFGLNQDTLISINNIKNTRLVQIGQVLRIPNQDGIMYTVKKGDTLEAIAEKYKSNAQDIQIANELFSDEALPGTSLFIPGARLDWMERQEINGDLFIWPVNSYITSPYGYRIYPFDDDGGRQFHTGIDIGASTGTPVKAAMSGRVSFAGWNDVFGNHVVISHHAGYRTLYGHMSVIRVKTGAYVGTGERIGDVGSTGRSTGPHLHFTVYKNGVTVNPRSLLK